MNIRQLRFFIQITELGSVTRAAMFLHIAQPALSRQIRQLEEELGVTLFQRSDKGVALTDAGRLLRERTAALLQHFERVRHEVRDKFDQPSGELTLAMPQAMFELLTMPAIVRYRETYPAVLLKVFEGISGVLNAWSMVQLGRADLAIVTNVEPLATLDASPFFHEALCLIGPRGAGPEPPGEVDLHEVARRPLIIPSRPNILRLVLETAMAQQKQPLNIALEGNSPPFVLAAVEAGLGHGVLPFCAAYRLHRDARVSIMPIRGVQVSWTLIHRRNEPLSIAGERMKSMLRQIAHEQVASGHWRFATISP